VILLLLHTPSTAVYKVSFTSTLTIHSDQQIYTTDRKA